MEPLTISQVASSAGVGIETVRFYERQGLIPEPPRSPSGYRLYPPEIVRRIRFIRRSKELGFSLKEVAELLALRDAPSARPGPIVDMLRAKLRDIDDRIATLRASRAALDELIDGCVDGTETVVAVLRQLEVVEGE